MLSRTDIVSSGLPEAFGLPHLPTYLGVAKGPHVRKGVNLAVAGATAIDPSFFYTQEIELWTNDSLSVQLGWFQNLKSSPCTTKQGFYGGGLRACCGGGGQYHCNNSVSCGDPGSTVCKNPLAFVDWDGIHLTESAYHRVAKGLIYGGFTSPPLLS
ncbi:hypothetical protein NL676_012779 [Syzygium grande]|nr:hypothetical protein NL676_012779 [Syzygium grande]